MSRAPEAGGPDRDGRGCSRAGPVGGPTGAGERVDDIVVDGGEMQIKSGGPLRTRRVEDRRTDTYRGRTGRLLYRTVCYRAQSIDVWRGRALYECRDARVRARTGEDLRY